MAIWKSYRLAEIITEIEENKYVLPVIQRRLVWDEEKMELLFDTLLKGDSFGGIMVIEEEKESKPLFNFRPFTKDGEFISSRNIDKLKQQQYFVIDGQQRLQSFYIGLKGSLNGCVLYFDLFSDYNEEYEFKFANDSSKLPLQSKDNNNRIIPEHNWYLVSGLYERLKETHEEEQVAKEIIKNQNITDTLKQEYLKENVKKFYKNTLGSIETIGVSKVFINKSLNEVINRQKMVELFKRLNDGGTKLSTFDLVASILKGYAWEMEAFLEEIIKDYEDIGLSQENLIKLIFLLQDNPIKEMASIEEADANFAIINKERIKNTIILLKKFLVFSNLYEYYKEKNRSFIPLFFIAYHIYHKSITNEEILRYFDNHETGNPDFPLIKKWLYHSLVNGVFRSKGAGWVPYKTGIKKLLSEMQKHKCLNFPLTELFKVYTDYPIKFSIIFDTNNLDQLDSSFVYYLMYDRSQTIRIQDIDHIMPKSILGTHPNKYEQSEINSIKNFQLLDYGTNRGEKNAKPFKDWVTNIKFVKDKQAYLSKHLIPSDENIWAEDNFRDFIKERTSLILNKINHYVPE
ncbi:MAG: DUF262 domain-containing protein [Ignavibacteriae bacterium]|nr:DUF262 domain-containing protein [Ignavibacteriota bacterium]